MANRHLAGKVAWVTGSSPWNRAGNWRTSGWLWRKKVVFHASSEHSAQQLGAADTLTVLAQKIAAQYNVDTLAVCGDLTQSATVSALVEQIHARFGRIGILVNNAGGDIGSKGVQAAKAGKPEHNDAVFISEEDLRTVLDRNPDDLHSGQPCGSAEMIGHRQRGGSSILAASPGWPAIPNPRSMPPPRRLCMNTRAAWLRDAAAFTGCMPMPLLRATPSPSAFRPAVGRTGRRW